MLYARRTTYRRYPGRVIRSFRCAETQAVFEGKKSRRFAAIRSVIERKLIMLDTAVTLNDLRSPPGNHLGVDDGPSRTALDPGQ
jgi:plasmid maintenance system killer protein